MAEARKGSAAITAQISRKGRPRGRPFQKGQSATVGRPFPKGRSSNPGGRPKHRGSADALLVELVLDRWPEYIESLLVEAIGHKPGAKQADIDLVHRLRGTGARKSNAALHQLIFERVLGRVPIEAKLTHAGNVGGQTSGTDNDLSSLKYLRPEEVETVAALLEKADRAARDAREAEAAAASPQELQGPESRRRPPLDAA
jgi:hypothetical protein